MTLPKLLLTTLVLLTLANFAVANNSQASQPGAESKGTVLITGANRGIGLALAEQFLADGYHVIGTARSPAKADALRALGAQIEQLDVGEQDSVTALASRLNSVAIDILINNAGITGHDAKQLKDVNVDAFQQTFNVNTLGPLRVIQALLPNLQLGAKKLTVNISSIMGSMTENTWGCCLGYRASKAALNSFNSTLAVDLGKQGFSFVVLHPGYVQTDMNKGKGTYTAEQSAIGLHKVIVGLGPQHNGKFFDHLGEALPW